MIIVIMSPAGACLALDLKAVARSRFYVQAHALVSFWARRETDQTLDDLPGAVGDSAFFARSVRDALERHDTRATKTQQTRKLRSSAVASLRETRGTLLLSRQRPSAI